MQSGNRSHIDPATAQAMMDPAFLRCLRAASGNSELVGNFDRLTGSNLLLRGNELELAIDQASGRLDADMGRFADFVRDTIYDRLSPSALAELRQ